MKITSVSRESSSRGPGEALTSCYEAEIRGGSCSSTHRRGWINADSVKTPSPRASPPPPTPAPVREGASFFTPPSPSSSSSEDDGCTWDLRGQLVIRLQVKPKLTQGRLEENNSVAGGWGVEGVGVTGTFWLADVTGSHCAETEGGLQGPRGSRGAPAATQST